MAKIKAASKVEADKIEFDRRIAAANEAAKEQVEHRAVSTLSHSMVCNGYTMVFSPGHLSSYSPNKNRDYQITKVDVKDGLTVRGLTQYGHIAAYFSDNGTSRVFWTSAKGVVTDECVIAD
jgi:hypothetical protein